MMTLPPPVLVHYGNVVVVRDDLLAGGARHAAAGFLDAALEAVRRTAARQATFIVDDVWRELAGAAATPERRAMGAAIRAAVKAGLIEPTDMFRASAQVKCHANPRRVWRSRVK